jgi:glycosyltransferase involved in cell wall biosynthesis
VLVPPGDATALAGALNDVLDGRVDVSKLIASGECRAAHFSMEHLADRYLELYGTLVA